MPKQIGDLKLFDADELAHLLGITKKTINDYFRTGKILGRKIGREWYTTEGQITNFMLGTVPPDFDHWVCKVCKTVNPNSSDECSGSVFNNLSQTVEKCGFKWRTTK